ncbi:hypothetical protein [Olivibacter sp. XZL3]|uniref:hypothetical protein n=1 Tax=Olivibacter sp. XZL3 TaxID=1735116 RepID=UPI001066987F|nr:hypothetical protein [Olivibacter sp. XZL3]
MENKMGASDEARIVEEGFERRGYSAFFGEGLKQQVAKFLASPEKPTVLELDKSIEDDKLHFSMLVRSFDPKNPVPAILVSRNLPNGKKAELFVNSAISFSKAANLLRGKAVQLNSNKIGEFDPLWLRARFDADRSGTGELVHIKAYQSGGKVEIKNLFALLELETKPNFFLKELWLMKLVNGDMPFFKNRYGKFHISAEPEINSLSLWDKDRKLLIRDITNEEERLKVFNPDRLSKREREEQGKKPGPKL